MGNDLHAGKVHTGYPARDNAILILEGMVIGIVSGLTIVVYRYLLTLAENGLFYMLDVIDGNALYTALWFVALVIMACIVSLLVRWEEMAGGSGLPQVSGEVQGRFDACWWRVIAAKITAASIAIFGGLSLGRGGPSIQLGAMAGKGYARAGNADVKKERAFLSCGAGAGLAATFNAPVAGIMFVVEEIRRGIDRTVLTAGIASVASAAFVSRIFFGQGTIFSYQPATLPLSYYWLLVLFGMILGFAGAGFNFVMLKSQALFGYFKKVPKEITYSAVFVVSGILALNLKHVLAGGRVMANLLEQGHPVITVLIGMLIAKFLFTMLCVGAGIPGGIFFPLLILGSYLGAIYGDIVISFLPLGSDIWQQFIILGMAGLFAGIIRTPITGIVLIAEMTGSTHSLLDITVVSIFAYVAANLLGSKPICTSLLENMLKTTSKH